MCRRSEALFISVAAGICALLFFGSISAFGKTIHVPGDAATIQAGINSSSNGDTVLVAPGTYLENINFEGKAITVASEQGPSVTIIDGRQMNSVVIFANSETSSAVLNGFTLQNGNAGGPLNAGGGIYVSDSSPTILNNIITNNQASYAGGGIGVEFGSPLIQGNVITNNLEPNGLQGGGISISGASTCHVTGNIISNNTGSFGGGIGLWAAGAALIENNTITGNRGTDNGGGISLFNDASSTVIAQNMIQGNVSPNGNGVYWSDPPAVFADNTVVDGPLAQGGSTVFAEGFWNMLSIVNNIMVADGGGTYGFSCDEQDIPANIFLNNDVFSTGGTPYGGMCTNQTGGRGNISADPKFVANGFALQPGSPAIDAGTNSGLNLLGADIVNNPRIVNGNGGASAIVDIGAYEFIPSPLQFVAITPCRIVDTRGPDGQFGGPAITGGNWRSFPLPANQTCGIPATAITYSLNITAVPNGRLGYLTVWPTGPTQPAVSTLNSLDGRTKANAGIIEAGNFGAVSVYVTNTANVVIDIDGYFTTPSQSTLKFYPLTPCRVADTRDDSYPQGLGAPHLSGQVARDFPVLNNTTCIPSNVNAAAYSFNLTAIPYQGAPLGYLEVWPTGEQPQSPVSTLNNPTGTTVANAAIVPAGSNGAITVYPSGDTDLAIDINGYFAATGDNGLSLYPTQPCRVIDTRNVGNGQPFTGTLSPPVDVVDSPCGIPSAAQAYVFNATVIPSPTLNYLTLWPDGEGQPVVSTLNAVDGWIASNLAIVPNQNGKIDAYARGMTQLILDISSYFAP